MEYEAFSKRDLSEIRSPISMSTASPNASVWGRNGRRFAAWGIGVDGRKVLLALMAGSKEGVETVRAFFRTCAHEAWAIPSCEFRFNPARDSDLMSAAVPI